MKPSKITEVDSERHWAQFASLVISYRWLLFALASLIGVFSIFVANQFRLDRRLESMFRHDDPVLQNFLVLKRSFGGNDVLMVVYRDDAFWIKRGENFIVSDDGLKRLQSLSESIAKVSSVLGVMDLSRLDTILKMSEPATSVFHLFNQHSGIHSRSAYSDNLLKQFEGYTHVPGKPWIALACILDSSLEAVANRSETIAELRLITEQALERSFDVPDQNSPTSQNVSPLLHRASIEYYLVGEPVMVEEGFEMIESDGLRLGWTSSIVLVLLLVVGMRALRWAILTIVVVQWSLWVTRAVCVVVGWQLTMVSSMLIAIVTVIGIATSMHLLVGFRRQLTTTDDKKEAFQRTLQSLMRPVFWACVTDAIGFAALLAAKIEPVRDYGLMMAVASIVVGIGMILIAPAILLIDFSSLRNSKNLPLPTSCRLPDHPDFAPWSSRLLDHFLYNRAWTIVFLIVWLGAVVWGNSRLEVETDFLKNFRSDSKLAKGYSIVESELGGAGVWDILIPAPTVISEDYLEMVNQLEDELRTKFPVQLTKVISLAGADQASKQSPVLASIPVAGRFLGMETTMPIFFRSMLMPVESDAKPSVIRWMRIMLRSREQMDVGDKLRLIDQVNETANHFISSDKWKHIVPSMSPMPEQAIVTGYFVLLANLVQSVVSDQWVCFVVATVGIFLAIWIATGNVKLALVALIPNTLPAMGVIAWLGIIGMKMNLGAALIAAVSIGISVDTSLHYLIHYQRCRRHGSDRRTALRASQEEISFPVLLSTLALVLGFGALGTSEFIPTVVFGIMSAVTMLFSVLGNLWWLPVLVDVVDQ